MQLVRPRGHAINTPCRRDPTQYYLSPTEMVNNTACNYCIITTGANITVLGGAEKEATCFFILILLVS